MTPQQERDQARVSALCAKVVHVIVAQLQGGGVHGGEPAGFGRGTGTVAKIMDKVQKEGARLKLSGSEKSEVVRHVVQTLQTTDAVPEVIRNDLRALVDADLLQPMIDVTVGVAKGALLKMRGTIFDCGCLGPA